MLLLILCFSDYLGLPYFDYKLNCLSSSHYLHLTDMGIEISNSIEYLSSQNGIILYRNYNISNNAINLNLGILSNPASKHF